MQGLQLYQTALVVYGVVEEHQPHNQLLILFNLHQTQMQQTLVIYHKQDNGLVVFNHQQEVFSLVETQAHSRQSETQLILLQCQPLVTHLILVT